MVSYKKVHHVEERMGTKRKQHSAEFKFKVALEAAKEQKTLSQLGSEYELHPTQISEWKRQLLSASHTVFGKEASRSGGEQSKSGTHEQPHRPISNIIALKFCRSN